MTESSASTALLVTGGIDSTLLMYMFAERNPKIITVNYQQIVWPIQEELIRHHMKVLGIVSPLISINMFLHDWQKTPGLFEKGWIPNDSNPNESFDHLPHESYFVEGRNAIMLCYVLAYCSAHGIDEVITGYEYEKNEWSNIRTPKLIADDTSPHFLDTVNILALSGFSRVTRIRAPFYEWRWDKERIVRESLDRGIDLNKTYSCYFFPGPCGKCDNCLLKEEALRKCKVN